MTPDAVMVLAHGLVLDREAAVASLDEAPPWQSYDISDERLIEVGDRTAVLVCRGRASRDDDGLRTLMSTVYVRRDGQ